MIIITADIFPQDILTLSGKISDIETTQTIPAVSIRIGGTSKGTITNANGFFQLSLQPGKYILIFSHVGYKSDSLIINLDKNKTINISLKPVQIQLSEIIVIAEDPAIEIIRKAIANKRKWMDKLQNYKFEAFTRQTICSDTSIAGINESYTDGFWQKGDTLREIIKQRRQTENIPASGNFAAVRQIANFNEDEIKLIGYTFIGPTSPDALEYYDYKLLRTFDREGLDIYEIQMIPKSLVKPLFEGKILISDYTFAVMGIDVTPNDAFNIPFVKDLIYNYKQQFLLYDDEFWMPTDVRISGGFKIGFAGIKFPKFTFDQTSVIYDYKLNTILPDTIFKKSRVTVDSSAVVYDTTFWQQNEFLPLTVSEQAAYDSLDSSKTMAVQFKPSGVAISLGSDTGGVLSYLQFIDAHFNRTEGFFLGLKYSTDTLFKNTSLQGSAGYGFSDEMFKFNIKGIHYPDNKRRFGLGISIYRNINNTPDAGFYNSLQITLASLIGKNDYWNYYLNQGLKTFLIINPINFLKTSIAFIDEMHRSVGVNSNQSLIALGNYFRDNPPIIDGQLRAFQLNLRYGQEPVFLNLISVDAIEFLVEHSSPEIIKSDYHFTSYFLKASYSFRTFLRSHLFSPVIRVNLNAGTSRKNLPPQKHFTVDSQLSGFAPFGVVKSIRVKEHVGDQFISLSLEHNFRSVPFLALGIPFLYKKHIEFIIHSSISQTWLQNKSQTNGWYYEAGIGIGKIFDLLRADLTYRFPNDERKGRLFFTMSTSQLF